MHSSPSWIPSFGDSSPWGLLHSKGTGKGPPGKQGARKCQSREGGRWEVWPSRALFHLSRTQTQGTSLSLSGRGSGHGDWVQVLIPPTPTLAGTIQVCNQSTPHLPEGEGEFRQPARSYLVTWCGARPGSVFPSSGLSPCDLPECLQRYRRSAM